MVELFTRKQKREIGVCSSKKMYGDKASAKKNAKRLMQNGYNIQKPYHCNICTGWHLATVREKVGNEHQ